MPSVPDKILALFDLDLTLLPHDSDELWVRFLLEEDVLDRRYEASNRAIVARYGRGEVGALEFTEFYLGALTPFTQDELARWHETFMRRKIVPVIPQAARELTAKHRDAGHLVVLTTATSRFLSAPIARELGFVHLIATEPEVEGGRYTGRVQGVPNIREGKVDRLLAWLDLRGETLSDFRESWFYSDSRNDLPLLSRVTHPVAVNADPVLAEHARNKGWPMLRIA